MRIVGNGRSGRIGPIVPFLSLSRPTGTRTAIWGISEAYLHLAYFGGLGRLDLYPKIREAAEKALRIDEDLAEAYTTRAVVRLISDFDWTGSESDFKRAIEANAGSVSLYRWYATAYLCAAGRPREAIDATNTTLRASTATR